MRAKLSPAEKLSRDKPYRRSPSGKGEPREAVWICCCRERREALRLSLRDVAAAVGLSVTGYWQIERGSDPQLTTARRLAAFFGATVEQLWPKEASHRHRVPGPAKE